MSECTQRARPMMRRAACLHRDRARRQVRRPGGKAVKTESLVELRMACRISRARYDQILCEVHTGGSNLFHEFPFSDYRLNVTTQSWHSDAVRLTSVQGRGTPLYSLERAVNGLWLNGRFYAAPQLHR